MVQTSSNSINNAHNSYKLGQGAGFTLSQIQYYFPLLLQL